MKEDLLESFEVMVRTSATTWVTRGSHTSFSHNRRLSRGCKDTRMHRLVRGDSSRVSNLQSTFRKLRLWQPSSCSFRRAFLAIVRTFTCLPGPVGLNTRDVQIQLVELCNTSKSFLGGIRPAIVPLASGDLQSPCVYPNLEPNTLLGSLGMNLVLVGWKPTCRSQHE
jgi:hypothetical protein